VKHSWVVVQYKTSRRLTSRACPLSTSPQDGTRDLEQRSVQRSSWNVVVGVKPVALAGEEEAAPAISEDDSHCARWAAIIAIADSDRHAALRCDCAVNAKCVRNDDERTWKPYFLAEIGDFGVSPRIRRGEVGEGKVSLPQ